MALFASLIALAGTAQWMLVRRAHDVAASLIVRLVPYGDLRYERLWPWPWGAGHAWNLGFEPQGLLSLSLRAPPGMRIEARELLIRELRRDARGRLQRLRGRLLGVRVPLAPPTDAAWPTLSDLGYAAVVFDLDFDLHFDLHLDRHSDRHYVAAPRGARLRLDARADDLGRARLDVWLRGTPQQFDRAPDQVELQSLDLRVSDARVLTRLKDTAVQRAGLPPTAWEASMIRLLDRRAARWHWDAAMLDNARQLIRDPSRLHLHLQPPERVLLRDLRRHRVSVWVPVLGFSLGGAKRAADRPAAADESRRAPASGDQRS